MPSAHLGQHCQPNSSSSLGPYQAAVCHHIFHLRSFSSLARLGIEPGTCWMPIMCLTIECSLHMGLSSADQRDLSPAHRADEVGGGFKYKVPGRSPVVRKGSCCSESSKTFQCCREQRSPMQCLSSGSFKWESETLATFWVREGRYFSSCRGPRVPFQVVTVLDSLSSSSGTRNWSWNPLYAEHVLDHWVVSIHWRASINGCPCGSLILLMSS